MTIAIPAEFTADFPRLPPPRSALPSLALHETTDRASLNPTEIIEAWVTSLLEIIKSQNASDIANLFVAEAWWRDLVALDWDTVSKYGPEAISGHLLNSSSKLEQISIINSPLLAPRLDEMGPGAFLHAGFDFRTNFGTGRGTVRLVNTGPDEWKAWTVSTALEALNEQKPVSNGHINTAAAASLDADELQVLVIGAGQAGVMLAAHLENLGLRYLLIERESRVGASWRNRYDILKTHTPSYMDHFPFLKYPSNWPKNPHRDQVCEWIESYSRIMGLKTLTSTTVTAVQRIGEGSNQHYIVNMDANGTQRTIKVKHLVLSTGFTAEPLPLDVPGQELFSGTMYHSSKHKSASQVSDLSEKTVTIVGSGTSAHDIAKDFVDHGAKQVYILQRNVNVFITLESLEDHVLSLWKIPGLNVEDGDLLETSIPWALAFTFAEEGSRAAFERDSHLLDGLESAGMALRRGADGIGIPDYLVVKGGHYYIDQGAAAMIVDGRIKIHRCKEGVKSFYDSGVELADGTKVDSDVIVTANGYKRGGSLIEDWFGKDTAKQADVDNWGDLDEGSERKGWWRPSGVPGLWFMTGPFSWSRQFSILLALQIQAVELGLNNKHFSAETST